LASARLTANPRMQKENWRMNKRDMPRWNAQGTPINAEAAMSDALLWLETIEPRDAQNRERLGACINALKRFCGDMT
jgi:hypothetical protein